jgi:hypothetical protein
MNCKVVKLNVIVALFLIQLTNSQPVTKVLQNGNDNYEGCKDSYTISDGPDVNYGDNGFLSHKNCQT